MTLTITLELSVQEEERLARKAARAGLDIADYVKRVATNSASPRPPRPRTTAGFGASTSKPMPQTGAELVASLKSDGVIGAGYGDPSIDSPELARRIHAEVWRLPDSGHER